METAEEFFRNKIKELNPNQAVITLSNEVIFAEQAMRWAKEYSDQQSKAKDGEIALLEVQLKSSKQDVAELKEVLKASEKNYVGKNSELQSRIDKLELCLLEFINIESGNISALKTTPKERLENAKKLFT